MQRFTEIAKFGKQLIETPHMDNALELISIEAKRLLNCERCSIFLVDYDADMLWTKHSDGIGRIAISIDSGIVGHTFKSKTPQLVNDPYNNEFFMPNIDKKTGFVTRNIITTLIFDSNHEIIGIIQLLNKIDGDFTAEDMKILNFFSNYVSGPLELSLIQEKSI
ncbi:GAF domain-containing protein [Sulfurimonas sp. HSL-1716]|uniref:GAF domain-containing protein n=1 Tax=Hydrocurvibacter sulfurireducens TaxID=3131937 RepID=UPI0031F735B6